MSNDHSHCTSNLEANHVQSNGIIFSELEEKMTENVNSAKLENIKSEEMCKSVETFLSERG